jgi:predicted ATPase/DNA-binding XRE family transcriptional regulator
MIMARREDEGAAPAFGTLLKTFRVQAALSQEQLAERAGVSISAIGALEQGLRRAPYRKTLEMLCDALDCDDHARAELDRAANAARSRRLPTAGRPSALPTPRTSFFERTEVGDIAALLERRRFITITGAGGIGKTRTALEIGRKYAAKGIAGCFVDLTAVSDADGIWDAIAAARELPGGDAESKIESVCRSVSSAPLLLVLDNCEHIVEHAANAAIALTADAPSLRLLTTSRERLGLTGELLYRLPSMQTPTALRLLIERSEASDAHAHEALDDVERLKEICGLLDGIPLAIELAAFHLATLGSATVLARLREGLSLLGPRDLPQRHQTMAAAIAWSFDLLAPIERSVIERLSVFDGGFTMDAAQAVCAGDDIAAPDIPETVLRLVQKSLVNVEHSDVASTRYSLLETVRTYAKNQLEKRGASDATRRKHLHWLVQVAEEFSSSLPRRSPATLHREMENIRSAVRWGSESDDERDIVGAATIAGRLRLVWFWLSRSAELQTIVERLLNRLRESEHESIVAHLCVALVNCDEWDADVLLQRGERALRLLQRTEEFSLAASVSAQVAVRIALLGRGREAELSLHHVMSGSKVRRHTARPNN